MRWIVSDNDNVMRAHLRHKKELSKNKGRFPEWVYEPQCMADPGHSKNTG